MNAEVPRGTETPTPAEVFGEEAPAGERISHKAKLEELRRELAMRKQVYPKQVERAAMSQEEADRRVAALQAIVADYEVQPWPQLRNLVRQWRDRAESLTVAGTRASRLHRDEILAVLAFAVQALRDAGQIEKEAPK